MKFSFDADSGLVTVRGTLGGLGTDLMVRLALDTGATTTLIDKAVLAAMGYEPEKSGEHVEIVTASGTDASPLVELKSIEALGVRRTYWPVIALALPADTKLDGLLGLDFLRGMRLTLDFRSSTIELLP